MFVGTTPERPMVFALGFANRQIIDAGEAPPHVTVFVEFPILIAVGAEPVAAVVTPLIGKAHGNAVLVPGPDLLDQPVLELARPFAREEADDLTSA